MIAKRLLILAFVPLLAGCAATQIWLEHKDLEAEAQMSHTVFLDPVPAERKTLWLDIRSTADTELDLSGLAGLLTRKGWRLVQHPDQANARLQVNVLSVGKKSIAAIRNSLYAGYGGAIAGAAAGAMAGTMTDSPKGIGLGSGIGGLIGGGLELVTGALVKKVTYGVITDVQLGLRSEHPIAQQESATLAQGSAGAVAQQVVSEGPWKFYRTRVAAHATKANLSFEEARPALTDRMVRSLAGILH